jgi:hypothetical protein
MSTDIDYIPLNSLNETMGDEHTKHNSGTNNAGLPRLPLDLTQHKVSIAIPWTIIVLSSGVLPIVGFFALRYGADVELNICLAPWLGFMGATSIFSLLKRSWDLIKKNSDCRPLGQQSRWAMDFFGWNFLFGFIVLSVIISLGIAFENLTVVALPLTVLLLYVCFELILVEILMAANIRAPFRCSSVRKGDILKPGVFIIVEDVVAVDGKQGRAFRQAWSERYESSAVMRAHLKKMDWLWGCTGLAVVAVVWGVVFGVDNKEIGYALGFALPWVWAGAMTVLTISMSKSMLRRESEVQRQSVPA